MIAILDQVKIFDQEIGASRPVAEQFVYLLKRVGLELASLGKGPGPLARADMSCRPVRPAAAIWGFFFHAYSLSLRPRPALICPAMREKERHKRCLGDIATDLSRQVKEGSLQAAS